MESSDANLNERILSYYQEPVRNKTLRSRSSDKHHMASLTGDPNLIEVVEQDTVIVSKRTDKDINVLMEEFNNNGMFSRRQKELPIELKFKKIMSQLLNHQNKPAKLILQRKHKKLLWKILLTQQKFERF